MLLALAVAIAVAVAVDATAAHADASYTRTPSGWVLSHCVHRVPSGAHIIKGAAGQGQAVHAHVGGPLLYTLPACARPFGWWPVVLPASIRDPMRYMMSQRAPTTAADASKAAAASASASSPAARRLLQLPPDYDGWLAYTELMDPAGYDQFLGYFSVPAAPKQIPDILYIFTVR